ncbi:helix-turn-helix domain-containing protein [Nocardiopsis tropica]|uniref:Helix-turn-helix domain-containing protein n=1 Tax=Nocardiopsis tropica TaxID=109330 RepID=A0ABU7KYL6_9ACTN|nr:helix-turn-helix domain-containing protein [Nocardiopsis umidischolae]MEE2054172.1 helix-turn-helix domain-containing protein [Nocardiopsis umidischolae]
MTDTAPAGRRDAFDSGCPSRTILNHVASRWGTLILTGLLEGPQRFHVIRDRVDGISEKMLSQNLRVLAFDGLVAREVEPSSPPKVTYSLTPLGTELAGHMSSLLGWITLRTDEILAAQERHGEG